MDIQYVMEQRTRSTGHWELVPSGDFETMDAALAAMESAQTDLGWRDLRIMLETVHNGVVTERVVAEYGLKSEEEDEDNCGWR